MRVAQVIDSLKMGGAEQLLTLLVQELTQRDIDVTVINLRTEADPVIVGKLQQHGITIRTMPASSLLAPFRLARLSGFLRSNKFQIVQTHLTSANIVGTLAAQLAGVKTVCTLHSIHTDPRYFHPVKQRLETGALRHAADRVVAVGYAVADAHRARLQRRIDVIPNAVAPLKGVGYVERSAIRKSLPGDPEAPLLISVGRLSPPKGYEVLIDAFSRVLQTGRSARLIIAGAGILEDQLRNQIISLKADGSIFLLGKREDVPQLLASSDIYVSASHWEGMPVSILEAMSAGLPVIATSVGDVPSVVSKHSGYLVPPGNPELLAKAIQRLLDHPQRAFSMGKIAKQYVETNHSPAGWVDQLLNVFWETIDVPRLQKAI